MLCCAAGGAGYNSSDRNLNKLSSVFTSVSWPGRPLALPGWELFSMHLPGRAEPRWGEVCLAQSGVWVEYHRFYVAGRPQHYIHKTGRPVMVINWGWLYFYRSIIGLEIEWINPQLSCNSTQSKVYLFCSQAGHNTGSSIGLILYEYLNEYLMESLILRYM